MARLTFSALREANLSRCRRWHPGFPDDEWTAADWSNAMAGEMGEAANIVKKLRRQETGGRGAADPDHAVLVARLAEEIADTLIYADLLAAYHGIELGEAVRRKFDAVSIREGFPERLGVEPADGLAR
jgi:NTP pyrophosphatase (non-canonical NTP hydrolase)